MNFNKECVFGLFCLVRACNYKYPNAKPEFVHPWLSFQMEH